MNVQKVNWISYDLIFAAQFNTSKSNFRKRKTYILQLEDSSGNKFFGECAPLPEFGSASFNEIEEKLNGLENEILGFEISEDFTDIEKLINNFDDIPPVKSAIEQCLIHAYFYYYKDQLWNYIPEPTKKQIFLNGLIGLVSPLQCAETSMILEQNGYSTIKLKAGRENFEDDLKAISKTAKALSSSTKIRIDVNGRWNFEQAKQYLDALKKFNIEYVEQPVSSKEELIKLSNEFDIPIAADESLRSLEDAETLLKSNIKYFIVKPALIGGIHNTLKIFRLAKDYNKKIIISSSFESALGRNNLFYLASLLPERRAHGLTFSNHFTNDIFENDLRIQNGSINLPSNIFPSANDLSHLFNL